MAVLNEWDLLGIPAPRNRKFYNAVMTSEWVMAAVSLPHSL
jgi:hypothetical protein